ncbi:DUF2271 domain-containing protein [Alteriqipengyuania lutimaris]|uniref:DUF2271 domain-containing protein n=1 Tax=Alteriqipengyuania lutimaris TaxID=1538146 RepID=A0A395LP21_9SPHN|nr:DUF2271 domain-containing protein [Alteriqipengyuania lutimaris]RDS78439.1 DUF2271 domain-containing protein [Alteriqipengyuania lutimaris]
MRKAYRIAIPVTAAAVAAPAAAGEMQVRVEIPRLRVAEYHNPYVAIWLEDADGKAVANLDVWYDVDLRGDDPRKWLPDMRTWWRRAGRTTDMPADGISGPTQAPGNYTLRFSEGTRPLPRLAAGSYVLRVEAAREVGGRELVSIPFQWPPAKPMTGSKSGSKELGTVRLSIQP